MIIQQNGPEQHKGSGPNNTTLNDATNTENYSQKITTPQGENDPSRITCSSMRSESLRASFDIDSDRIIVAWITARAFNREGLDDDADEMVRTIWRLMRVSVTLARQELQRLRVRL
jgi:hypothetical protein